MGKETNRVDFVRSLTESSALAMYMAWKVKSFAELASLIIVRTQRNFSEVKQFAITISSSAVIVLSFRFS